MVALDRWHLSIIPAGGDSHELIFCNYFSIGFDARVIAKFDAARKRHKGLYQFRIVNYFWFVTAITGGKEKCAYDRVCHICRYFLHSVVSMFGNAPLDQVCTLVVDGEEVKVYVVLRVALSRLCVNPNARLLPGADSQRTAGPRNTKY